MSTENLAPASLGHAACITSGGVAASLSRMASLSLGPSVALKVQSASAHRSGPGAVRLKTRANAVVAVKKGKKSKAGTTGTPTSPPPQLFWR